MNITLLKELEDNKSIQHKLSVQLRNKIDAKVNQYIETALNDFEKFFIEKGFTLQAFQFGRSASYGSLTAIIKHNDPSVQYFGTYIRLDLSLQLPHKVEYIIALNRKDRSSSVSVSYSTGNQDEDSQLKKEIERIKSDNEECAFRIENFKNEEWTFILRDNKNSVFPSNGQFDTIYDLLTSLIK